MLYLAGTVTNNNPLEIPTQSGHYTKIHITNSEISRKIADAISKINSDDSADKQAAAKSIMISSKKLRFRL